MKKKLTTCNIMCTTDTIYCSIVDVAQYYSCDLVFNILTKYTNALLHFSLLFHDLKVFGLMTH